MALCSLAQLYIRRLTACLAAVILWALATAPACCDSADVTIPMSVSFNVTDVDQPTEGTPSPTTAAFSSAILSPGNTLRLAVQAANTSFTRPVEAGGSIPAAALSWSIANTTNGTGFPGTLSAIAYTKVFESSSGATSGSVDLSWTLAAPGGSIRAGMHSLTVTWKVESFAP